MATTPRAINQFPLTKTTPGQGSDYLAVDEDQGGGVFVTKRTPSGNIAITPIDTIAQLRTLKVPGIYRGRVQVMGYYAVGDGGGGPVRYYDSGHATGYFSDNGGSIIVPTGGDGSAAWLWSYSGDVNCKWFGAKGDGIANDTSPFVEALAETQIVFVPKGAYILDPNFSIPNGVKLFGEPSSGASTGAFSSWDDSRIVFSGSGAAGFKNASPTVAVMHAAMQDLVIESEVGSDIDYLIDLNGALDFQFENLRIENRSTVGGGLRSNQIGSDPTWLNTLLNVQIRVPDSSDKYALDIDWSDSTIVAGAYTGGLGSRYRGPGNLHALGVMFDRGNSSGAGLILKKTTTSNGQINVTGCSFDDNPGAGLILDLSASPGGTVYAPTISACGFRNNSAPHDIIVIPHASDVITGPTITGCCFTESAIDPILCDDSKTFINIAACFIANTAWRTGIFKDTRSRTSVLGRDGININGPVMARASYTFRGMANVALMLGINSVGGPMLIGGSKDDTTPFIGASRSSAGAASDFGVSIDGDLAFRWTANKTSMRPESDGLMSVGGPTNRVAAVYHLLSALTDGITAPSALPGFAQVYVDSADGDLKVKFGNGVTKTLATNT